MTKDETPPHFGHFLYGLIEGRHSEHAAFARKMGITYRQLYRYEEDARPPRRTVARNLIAAALGMTWDELDAAWKGAKNVKAPVRRPGPILRSPTRRLDLPADLTRTILANAVDADATVGQYLRAVIRVAAREDVSRLVRGLAPPDGILDETGGAPEPGRASRKSSRPKLPGKSKRSRDRHK